MMVGLTSQVATLVVFGFMALDVFFRTRKFRGEFNESTNTLRKSKHFKGLLGTIHRPRLFGHPYPLHLSNC